MATANDLNISQPGIVTFDGTATFNGRTLTAGSGISITNGNGISGNPIISSTASTTDLHTARYIVSPGGAADGANFTTIAGAISAAVGATGKQTIFIQPGTYTENLTLVGGIDLTAFQSDSSPSGVGNVIIVGTCTMTTAGTVTISGIQLQTNSAAFLAVTGSAASIVNIEDCYLNCTNNTGITYSAANTSSAVILTRCNGNLGTTGIGLFTATGTGTFQLFYTQIGNSGASTTASTCSACLLVVNYCLLNLAITTSSTASLSSSYNTYSPAGAGLNTTALTAGGSGSHGSGFDVFSSGSASAISVGTGCTLIISQAVVASTNTNAITGAGTIQYQGISFTAASSTINTTTQSIAGTLQGSKVTAPTAGFIGEQIRSAISGGSAVSITTSTLTNITSISLTAGIWDVSLVAEISTAGAFALTNAQFSISTTSATLGTDGDNSIYSTSAPINANNNGSCCIPSYRLTLTATTTVYYVALVAFTGVGGCKGFGRLSATRVG